MILLTQNLLVSPMKGAVKQSYLEIEAEEVEEKEREFDTEFIKKMIERIDYTAFVASANSLGKGEGLPTTVEELNFDNDDHLKAVHHALLEVNIVKGNLVCTETGRKFPISAGIPNMILNQDEV